MAGLVNSIYGIPFVAVYTITSQRKRNGLYWSFLYLLGNSLAYMFIMLLILVRGEDLLGFTSNLKPLFSFLISIISLFIAFVLFLTSFISDNRNEFLAWFFLDILITGAMIFLLGFLMGFYLGKNVEGVAIYLKSLSSSSLLLSLSTILFCLGTFVSPLYIIGALFQVFTIYIRTVEERRLFDLLSFLLLVIIGLLFYFRR